MKIQTETTRNQVITPGWKRGQGPFPWTSQTHGSANTLTWDQTRLELLEMNCLIPKPRGLLSFAMAALGEEEFVFQLFEAFCPPRSVPAKFPAMTQHWELLTAGLWTPQLLCGLNP